MTKLETKDGKLFIGGKEVLKGWESMTGWYWFATELETENYNGDNLWYGFVQGFSDEWGSFWEGELKPLIQKGMVWEINAIDLPIAGRRA